MFCVVFQLRRNGEKLPVGIVRSGPTQGYLVLQQRAGWPIHDAMLLKARGSTTELLQRLEYAQVVKVRGGILMRGFEIKKFHENIPQAWWCVPGRLDDLTTAL